MKTKITTNKTIKSLALEMFGLHFFEGLLLIIICEVFISVPASLIKVFAYDSEILAWINDIYVLLISGPLQFAEAIFFLCNFRNQRVGLNSLMHGFDFWVKSASVFLAYALRVTIGLILFIVPGVISAIRYSQAMYILVDDPTKSASQCMAESKEMMKGNGLNLISFYLSYAGWIVLAIIPSFILVWNMYDPTKDIAANPEYFYSVANALSTSPWYIVCELIMLVLLTYISMGQAAFYDIYSGNLIFQEPDCLEANAEEI